MDEKVIITAALTGVATTRKQCPYIPYTPEELAEEAYRAYNAGATVVHIHARENDGSPTQRVEVYEEILKRTREKCPVIINFSTGAIGIPVEERIAHVRDLKPEIGALNMGSMNYAKFSERENKFHFDSVFANPFKDIIKYLEAMNANGVKPELECFDTGHVGNAEPLIKMGILQEPIQFSLILGVLGGISPTTQNLCHMVSLLPPRSTWEVIGISHVQWKLIAAALSLGGNIRVGLEDNFYLNANEMAKSNGELVEKAVRMTEDTGRQVASIDEARKILSLG
jgi:3-keto-5-aminohexanoate cleavage enzyme